MFSLDARFTTRLIKPLETAVGEAFDHPEMVTIEPRKLSTGCRNGLLPVKSAARTNSLEPVPAQLLAKAF